MTTPGRARRDRAARAVLVAGLVLTVSTARPQPARRPTPQLYDLRRGDHLIYRQRLEREVRTPTSETVTRMEWTSHLMVLAEVAGRAQVGIQRNRTALQVVRLRANGKDRKESERQDMERRLAQRDPAFAEANLIDGTGEPRLPWSALRETASQTLPDFHEIEPLPGGPLQAGATWPRSGGFSMRVVGPDPAKSECLALEGSYAPLKLEVHASFCPALHALAWLDFEGTYPAPPDRTIHEKLRLEHVERRRDEDVAGWLGQPDLRRGALAALATSAMLPIPASALVPLLETADVPLQRQVLSLTYRHGVAVPSARLSSFFESTSAPVRTLAVRNLESSPPEARAPLLARARRDTDEGVRRAAARLEERHAPDEAVAAQSRVARGQGPLPPVEGCPLTAGWAERALVAQRAAAEAPGTTLRWIRSGPHAGHPYLLRVPEDYRGDEPFPLLVYLSGGPGLAISGALDAADAVDGTSALVVYPQAKGYWWDPAVADILPALLDELLASLDVDTNRVFVTGFSNGGTGTLLYATLWPHRWAAAAPLMGAGFSIWSPQQAPAGNLFRLPLLFLHGDADKVIPAYATQDAVKAIRGKGHEGPLETEILKGRGHDVRLGADGERVLGFLLGQVRDPFPRRVVLETNDLDHARSFWVEVLDKKSGLARVEAAIDPDQTIRVKTSAVKRLRLLLRRELLPHPDQPVRVMLDGREAFAGPFVEDCGRLLASWRATRDPFLAHAAEITLDVK